MTHACDAARAAFLEANRPDLAERVVPNRRGWPSFGGKASNPDDFDVIIRAFWLGHLAGGHPDSRPWPPEEGGGLWCDLCSNGLGGEAS